MPMTITRGSGSVRGFGRGGGSTYKILPASSSINEGSGLTFNVTGALILNGTYYWTINLISSISNDLSALSGSFSISSNAGSFTVYPTSDQSTEGTESFTVSIRSLSVSGPVLATSSTISINDTSLTPTQSIYTSAGTYSWVAFSGVYSVCVVAVGAGGSASAGFGPYGANAGALGYKNNISVSPGSSYTVVVGSPGYDGNGGGDSYFINGSTVRGGGGPQYATSMAAGATYTGDGGGMGGTSEIWGQYNHSGGGAGGYSGQGGKGVQFSAGNAGTGGAGGSGGGGGAAGAPYGGGCCTPVGTTYAGGGGGGGVGLYGAGASGGGGSYPGNVYAGGGGGGGGSGGSAGGYITGGAYGGGGAMGGYSFIPYVSQVYGSSSGGPGAVRIIWGGGRSFPSNAS